MTPVQPCTVCPTIQLVYGKVVCITSLIPVPHVFGLQVGMPCRLVNQVGPTHSALDTEYCAEAMMLGDLHHPIHLQACLQVAFSVCRDCPALLLPTCCNPSACVHLAAGRSRGFSPSTPVSSMLFLSDHPDVHAFKNLLGRSFRTCCKLSPRIVSIKKAGDVFIHMHNLRRCNAACHAVMPPLVVKQHMAYCTNHGMSHKVRHSTKLCVQCYVERVTLLSVKCLLARLERSTVLSYAVTQLRSYLTLSCLCPL